MKTINDKLASLYENCWNYLTSRRYKVSLLFTFVFSMLANAFMYFNLYPQHDSLTHVIGFVSNWEISLGRFLLPYWGKIQGEITIPWIVGILSIVFISFIVYIVCDLLELNSTWQIAIVSGILSANLCITELASVFTYTVAVYMFSTLLSCLGVYIWVKRESVFRYPVAVILFVLSIGLYQAEIVFAITLLALLAIKDLLGNKNTVKIICKYLKIGMALVCAAFIYYCLYKLVLSIYDIEVSNSYNSISNIKDMSLEQLAISIANCYKAFLNFFYGNGCFISTSVTRVCNILLTCMTLVSLCVHVIKNKNCLVNTLLMLFILLLIPSLICMMDIFMTNSKLSFYILYSLYLYYILMLSVLNQCKKADDCHYDKIEKSIVIICFCLLLSKNIIFSNQIYSYQKIMYDRSVSIASRILEDIESDENYEMGETEVIFVGALRDNEQLKKTLQIKPGLGTLVNNSGLNGGKVLSITYNGTFNSFAYLLGSELNYLTDTDIISEYTSLEEVINMPAYPKNGYCKFINGRMVIKLS